MKKIIISLFITFVMLLTCQSSFAFDCDGVQAAPNNEISCGKNCDCGCQSVQECNSCKNKECSCKKSTQECKCDCEIFTKCNCKKHFKFRRCKCKKATKKGCTLRDIIE